MNVEAADQASSSVPLATKNAAVIAVWLGGMTLADVQAWIGIASGLAVLVYTLINIYVTCRDKLRTKP